MNVLGIEVNEGDLVLIKLKKSILFEKSVVCGFFRNEEKSITGRIFGIKFGLSQKVSNGKLIYDEGHTEYSFRRLLSIEVLKKVEDINV